MRYVNECIVADEQIAQWTKAFVPQYAPYYIIDPELVDDLVQFGLLIYTNPEFSDAHMTFGLEYGMIFNIWGMKPHSDMSVCYLSDVELEMLPEELRVRLFQTQRHLGRGHVYSMADVRGYVGDVDFEGIKHLFQWTFDFDGDEYLVLTDQTWGCVSQRIREQWVLGWVKPWLDEEGEGVEFTSATAQYSSSSAAKFIASRVNRFPTGSGANCFAAAIAPAIQENVFRDFVIEQWLHEGPLLRLLGGLKYDKVDVIQAFEEADDKVGPEDVLIWRDVDGNAIHGAFAIDATTVFNKMGQSWCQPWRVLPLKTVVDYNGVVTGGGGIEVYRRK